MLYAGYALPFIRPEAFPRVWADIVARVRPGGFLVVNLFGVHDTWASDPDMTFVDAERVQGLVAGLEVAVLDEVENDGDSFDGPKHWHVFDIVARRPRGRVAMTSAASRPRPPSVERVLAAARPATAGRDPAAVLAMARAVVDEERARLAGPTPSGAPRSPEALGAEVAARLASLERIAGPERVINATGVIVHTNLGRAPWPEAAIRAAREAAEGTLFLELDRATGRRGRRYREAEAHLVALTGAEDALIVTNNAAAVALAVGLAGRGGVAVSRGELVEIGGGVRIPEIVRRAGAKLVEVGTTNRTRASDFEAALEDGRARLVLRVHPSNFSQAGFVEAPDARGPRPRPPTGSARSSSTTSAAARCSTPRRSGWPTSRCRASGWPTGRTS